MTPQDTEAAKGPFLVEPCGFGGRHRKIVGPIDGRLFRNVMDAEEECDRLNAAWLAGRASGPKVEQIMKVVLTWLQLDCGINEAIEVDDMEDLRVHLTKLIEGK